MGDNENRKVYNAREVKNYRKMVEYSCKNYAKNIAYKYKKDYTARAVMTKLRDMKVVKVVNGKGKGKYVFIE